MTNRSTCFGSATRVSLAQFANGAPESPPMGPASNEITLDPPDPPVVVPVPVVAGPAVVDAPTLGPVPDPAAGEARGARSFSAEQPASTSPAIPAAARTRVHAPTLFG